MKQITLVPSGWPCTLEECPPGPFIVSDRLCFKSEYGDNEGKRDIYNSAGEFWCGGYDVVVQPVETVIEDVDTM